MKKNNLYNFLFEFDNTPCSCNIEQRSLSPLDKPQYILKFAATPNHPLHYAYAPQKGLCLTSVGGGELESDVLAKLLAVKADNPQSYIEFFGKYGFLLEVSPSEYYEVEFNRLRKTIERIKALIVLISALNKNPNYDVILSAVTYLLFSRPVSLSRDIPSVEIHPFTSLLHSNPSFIDFNRQAYRTGSFSVEDTVYSPKTEIEISYYNEIRGSEQNSDNPLASPRFKDITALHTSLSQSDGLAKLIADFYYHYQVKVGIIRNYTYKKLQYYSQPNQEAFDDELKKALLIIAKDVIAEEINSKIYNIHPVYSLEEGSPKWCINNLLEAIYFSVFYIKPGTAIYKQCANPNCRYDKFFIVQSTRTNRDYCCDNCRTAAAMQRSRAKKVSGLQ